MKSWGRHANGQVQTAADRQRRTRWTNPRIRRFLENYEGEPTYDQIALALDVAGGDDKKGTTTPEKLRNSILTNGGIMQPIIVRKRQDGTFVCIEGNTRLYIYRSFAKDGVEGDWSMIPALVHESIAAQDVDAIRLQAHLVGPRPWDPYSRAKYLWELQLAPQDQDKERAPKTTKSPAQTVQSHS